MIIQNYIPINIDIRTYINLSTSIDHIRVGYINVTYS
jgi:hypothetical protein